MKSMCLEQKKGPLCATGVKDTGQGQKQTVTFEPIQKLGLRLQVNDAKKVFILQQRKTQERQIDAGMN